MWVAAMMSHDARHPEKTMLDLPRLVPSGPAGGSAPAFVREAGVSGGAPEEDASAVAREES